MTARLEGKRWLVTAAAQGIGRASALALARDGARVWATDIDATGLAQLQGEHPRIETSVMDVRSREDVSRVVAAIDQLDGLFNCVGIVHDGTVLDCDEAAWNESVTTNLTSMYRTVRAVLPAMLERGRGNIINMSSVASSVRGVPRRFAYSTTKAAVIGLTKSIAADFVGCGIRCNAICPGTVHTPSLDARIAAQPQPELALSAFIARQPIGRLGRPAEIASLVVYLASDESSFTTGAIHVVDGGWTC